LNRPIALALWNLMAASRYYGRKTPQLHKEGTLGEAILRNQLSKGRKIPLISHVIAAAT
jgi:hypothetical protein